IASQLPGCAVSSDDNWISVLVNEDKQKVVSVLSQLQTSYDIRDMQLEEISSEEVIKRIYEGGVS
ncbi:MAG: ABC transporter ATP-binding protein, partial [Oscillospiraceae bacterium]|nr:ABC transporter ATP-binding protein [Oscillospiraceae bacterium]